MAKEQFRQSFTVPATSGSYAFERLTFGDVPAGVFPLFYEGVTASVDTSIATMVVELWLPRVGSSAPRVNSDYKYSGQFIDAATGMETWALAGYPGAQIRVKSGGTGGTAVVSASAF